MAFWADSTVEPKRQYRWLLYLGDGAGSTIPTYVCKKVSKPEFEVGEVEHTYLNHKFRYPGLVDWKEVTVTLVDVVDPDSSGILMRILQQSGYVYPDRPLSVQTISKNKAVKAMGPIIKLEQLGPTEIPVEEWELYNPWLKSAKFGELAYSEEELIDVELTIRFDYARLVKHGPLGASNVRITAEASA
tara:strand:- start:125 stop:688 length:564 start_codon:yes stop_codon:yes gene_type:complete